MRSTRALLVLLVLLAVIVPGLANQPSASAAEMASAGAMQNAQSRLGLLDVQTTPYYADFYSADSTICGVLVPVGTVINAYDPQGVHCGTATAFEPGSWGLMHVYGDDPQTTYIDEGAVGGDTITFYISTLAGPVLAQATGSSIWADQAMGALTLEACPPVTDTPEPTATDTPEPTATDTPEPTATDTPEPTATDTPEPTATDTPEPTATDTPEPTATDTPEPTATDTPEPTATDTPEPTATDTPEPTNTPTSTPMPSSTPTHSMVTPTQSHTPVPTETSTPVAPTSVTLSGIPDMLVVGELCSALAAVLPSDATTPITYTWSATNHGDTVHLADLSDSLTLSWDVPGTKTVTIQACNEADCVSISQNVEVTLGEDDDDVRFGDSADIDGDGKMDTVIWRQTNNTWYALLSLRNYSTAAPFYKVWGSAAHDDQPMVADLDGDGRSDLIVWRPANGTWYALLSSRNYSAANYFHKTWGSSAQGDMPLVGDLDGDSKADLIVWRPGNGTWYGLRSSQGYSTITYFAKRWGSSALGDMPIPADLDGDNKTDLVVWRPTNGTWYALLSSQDYSTASYFCRPWGSSALDDVPIARDLDGDAKADLIVWRPGNGTWYGLRSSQGYATSSYFCKRWGSGALDDMPVAGDLDADGKMDLIVWRPANGTWFGLRSSQGYDTSSYFGQPWGSSAHNDVPMIGR